MSRYNKAIGAVVGGVLGLAVSAFGLPENVNSPEVVGAVTTLFSLVAVFLFPANKP